MKNNMLVSPPRRPSSLAVCMAIIAVMSLNSAQAQDWKFEPIVRLGVEFDDNATLDIRTDEEVALEGYLVGLKADISYSSATTAFSIEPMALLKKYPDEPDFDSDEFYLQSQYSHEGQSNTLGFRVNFDQQSVRTAERDTSDLDIDDPDELTNDDSGRVVLTGTRSKWRIAPYWDYRMSNISTIGVNINYFDVRYEDVFANLLTDYTDARLDLNYRRKFSNVNTGLLTVTGRNYEVAGASDAITGYGVLAGFDRALSQRTGLKAMIGLEDAQQSGLNTDPQVVGYITLSRNLETIQMFAQYRRSISATGAGKLSARDSLNLNFRRRLSEKISAGLGVRAYDSGSIDGNTSIDDRTYVQLESSVLWYLSTSFVIEASYRYTRNDRSEVFGESSNSNRINLWFIYQPKTIPKL